MWLGSLNHSPWAFPITDHVVRFYEYLKRRKEWGVPINVYLFNNTERIIATYRWTEMRHDDRVIEPLSLFWWRKIVS